MKNSVIILISIFMAITAFWGCHLSSILKNEPYENYAMFAESNPPKLTDGDINTIAQIPADEETRRFTVQFVEPKHIRKIVIHNHNLFRFSIEYWDNRLQKWKTLESVRQRRDIEGISRRIQKEYVFKDLNFVADKLRIDVTRTVDDDVVSTTHLSPDDHIIDIKRRNRLRGGYIEYYRVLKKSPASLRELEIYGTPESEQLF